jgi:hypothetical protein
MLQPTARNQIYVAVVLVLAALTTGGGLAVLVPLVAKGAAAEEVKSVARVFGTAPATALFICWSVAIFCLLDVAIVLPMVLRRTAGWWVSERPAPRHASRYVSYPQVDWQAEIREKERWEKQEARYSAALHRQQEQQRQSMERSDQLHAARERARDYNSGCG